MSEEDMPIDRLIKVYIKMRLAKQELESKASEIETQMDDVKTKILDKCNEVNATSLRTPFGRVVRTLKTTYTTADWEALHNFMKDNDALDLLQRRIHQSNMKTFLEANPDKLPPGLNADRSYDVIVYTK